MLGELAMTPLGSDQLTAWSRVQDLGWASRTTFCSMVKSLRFGTLRALICRY